MTSSHRFVLSELRGDTYLVIVFHPTNDFTCTDCPDFHTQDLQAAAEHLKHHLPILRSLTLKLLNRCYSCWKDVPCGRTHRLPELVPHPCNVDLRGVILDFTLAHFFRPFLTVSSELRAPCMLQEECNQTQVSSLHCSSCPFAKEWKF